MLITSGYSTVSRRRIHWANDDDTNNILKSQTMRRNPSRKYALDTLFINSKLEKGDKMILNFVRILKKHFEDLQFSLYISTTFLQVQGLCV